MGVRRIETQAVISAKDQTGSTFSLVAQKLRGLEATAASVGKRMDSVARGMSGFYRAGVDRAAVHDDMVRRMSGPTRVAQPGLWAASAAARERMVQTAVTAGAAAAAQHPFMQEIIRQAAKRQHEHVRMSNSGMTEIEVAEAADTAAQLGRKYKSVADVDILHMLRNMRAITGSFEEASELAERLTKLRVIVQANRPGENVAEDFDQLVKGLEIKGVTQDKKQFAEYIEGIAKGVNLYGDTLKPYQYYEMFKFGRQATPGLSEKFILTTAPTLAQELGGSSYGKAVSAFNAAVVGNIMKHSAIKDYVKLGLLGREDVEELKSGEFKFKPGAHVKGWRLAQSDPNMWVREFLLPALEKAGVADKQDVLARISALFQNQTASQLVGILATQQSRIDKDARLYPGAKGTEAAESLALKDLHTALDGLHNQIKSLSAVAGKPFLQPLTDGINTLADVTGKAAAHFEKDPTTAAHATVGALGATGIASYLGLAGVGGLFGGPGFMAALGPASLVAAVGGTGLYAHWAWQKMAGKSAAVDAIFADHSGPIDRSPAALQRQIAMNRMTRGRSTPWLSGFSLSGPRGDQPGSAAPGLLGFGLQGFSDNQSLYRVPRGQSTGDFGRVVAALREHQKLDLNVTAEPLKIDVNVTASSDLVRIAGDAVAATRESKLNVRAQSGPGSTGSTDFGTQR